MPTGNQKPTRLAFDARLLFSGGIGTYARGLLKNAGRIFPSGAFDVTLLVRRKDAAAARELCAREAAGYPFRFETVADARDYSPRDEWEMAKALLKNRPDALYVPHVNVPVAAMALPGIKIAMTVHDLIMAHGDGAAASSDKRAGHAGARLAYLAKRIALRFFIRIFIRRAALVLTVSEAVAGEIFSRYGTRATAIPPLLSLDARAAAMPREGIVFIGHDGAHKNVRWALECLEADFPSIPVTLIGNFPKLSADFPRARYAKGASDAEKREMLARAAALAFPSRAEGFGIPPLEAMAYGCAAVLSAIPPLLETYADPAAPAGAFFFQLDDGRGFKAAMDNALALDGEARADMTDFWVGKFDGIAAVERYEKAFRGTLGFAP